MSVTFNDKEMAISYIKQMQREGHGANYKHIQLEGKDKYQVTLYPYDKTGKIVGQAFQDEEFGDKFIVYGDKVNTHTKLHELGHLNTVQHKTGKVAEMLDNELNAEKWAAEKRDNKVSERFLLNLAERIKKDYKNYSNIDVYYEIKDAVKRNEI